MTVRRFFPGRMALAPICMLACLCSKAQGVSVEAKIDSIAIFIGEQTGVTLTVVSQPDKVVQMPDIRSGQMLTPGVEVVDIIDQDTVNVDSETWRIQRKYLLTSFEENTYLIPAFAVKVAGKEYKTNPLALKVMTLEVDTLHMNQFFGPKDVQDNPFQWAEWSSLFWISFIALILMAIAVYLYVRLKQNKPIISRILIVKHIPAHQRALTAIDKIKQEKMQSSDDQKAYYTRLTDTLRTYIKERFGFNAMEMTTTEIIVNLNKCKDHRMISELRELFETADLVKFAKHSTLINENDLNLVNAISFIDQTKTQETETEERIVPKRSKDDERTRESRRIIKVLLWCVAVVVAVAMIYVIYNVLMLF